MLCAGALVVAPLGVGATGAATSDWQFSGTLYLWGAGIELQTVSGAKADIDFDTLLENLNMTFMGALEARKGEWSLVADVVYMNVGADKAGTVAVAGPGPGFEVDVDAGIEMKAWIWNLFGAYSLWRTPQATLDALAGARYLDVEVDFDLDLDAQRLSRSRTTSESGDAWNAIIGVKGRVDLNERWYVPYYADVGTGDSELTWQAFGGVGYRFDWGEMSLVYRHIEWDTGADRGVDSLAISGPTLSATLHF